MSKTINYRYKAFVSYCHKDTKFANKIIDALSQNGQYEVAKTLQPIFKDKSAVVHGQILSQKTIEELKTSAVLVVLCSPNGIENQDVNEEIRLFKFMGREKDILPIALDPLGVLELQDLMPKSLKYKVDEAGKVTSEIDQNIKLVDLQKHNPSLSADLQDMCKSEPAQGTTARAVSQNTANNRSNAEQTREITTVVPVKPVAKEPEVEKTPQHSQYHADDEPEQVNVTPEYNAYEEVPVQKQSVQSQSPEYSEQNINNKIITRDAKDIQQRQTSDVVDLNPIKRIISGPWYRNTYVVSIAACLVWTGVLVGGYIMYNQKSPTRINDNILPLMVRYAASGKDISQLPGASKGLKLAFTSIVDLSDKWPRYKEVYRHLKGGQPVKAEALLKDVAETKLNSEASELAAQAFRNYAAILSLRDAKAARVPFSQAAILDPSNTPGMFWHGWLQKTYGSSDEAKRALNQVMSSEKNSVNNWYINNARLTLWEIKNKQQNIVRRKQETEGQEQKIKRLKLAEQARRKDQNAEAIKLEEGADGWKAIGNTEEALKQYNLALKIRYTLVQAEPNKKEWHVAAFNLQNKLASIMVDLGDLTGAAARYQASLNMIDRLLLKEPQNKLLQGYQVETYQKVAQVKMVNREHNEALRLFTKALIIARPIAETTKDKLWTDRHNKLKKQIALLNVILSNKVK